MFKNNNYKNFLSGIFGVTIIAFTIIIALAIYIFYEILITSREKEIKLTLQSYTLQLNNHKDKYNNRVRRIATIAGSFYELAKSNSADFKNVEKELLNVIRKTTMQQNKITGIGIWFEPYKFDKSKYFYGPYTYWKNDSIIFTWDYSNSDYNYFGWHWYQNALPTSWNRKEVRPKDTYWSDLFLDIGSTKEKMITIASPIYDNSNEIVGVATLDIGTQKLMSFISEMKITNNSFSFLIQNKSKKIISFTKDPSQILNDYYTIPYLKNLDFQNSKDETKSETIKIDGKSYIIYYSNSLGDMLYGIVIPKDEIIKPLWKYFYWMIAVVILISSIIFVVFKFSIDKIYNLIEKNKQLSSYFYNIIDNAPDSIIILDSDGNFNYVNDSFCGLYEYSKDEAKTLSFEKISSEFYPEHLSIEYLSQTLQGGELDFDWVGKTKSGVEFPALIRMRLLESEGQKQVLSVITDMTEIVEVENELKQLNQELEERVEDRTVMLQLANENLEVEVFERKKVEENLIKTNEELLILNQTIANDSKKLYKLNQELSRSEQLLREANFTKDKFFSIIAHDLRNPLHAIKFNIDFLNRDFTRMEQNYLSELLKNTANATNHLHELLENLLLWSSSQSKKISFNPQNLALYPIISEIVNLYQQNLTKKKIEPVISLALETDIYGDENMIKTILRNLFSNSVKFTPNNGKITFKFSQSYDESVISITDTGVGMDQNQINELLNNNTSRSSLGTSNEKGTGLGILLCLEFIEYHNGRLEIESQKGIGSEFKIFIPNTINKQKV